MATLLEDITAVLNRHCAENASNTPDFILGIYLKSCLDAFDVAVLSREHWHGRTTVPDYEPSTSLTTKEEAMDPGG